MRSPGKKLETRNLKPERMPARNAAQHGFTLIEILVALMILSVGLVSVFALFGLATATHRRSVDAQTVADMAVTVFAELEKQFSKEKPVDLKDQKHELFSQGYKYDVQFTPLSKAGPQTYLARVIIAWQTRGKKNTETFEKVMFLGSAEKKK